MVASEHWQDGAQRPTWVMLLAEIPSIEIMVSKLAVLERAK